MVTAIFQPIQDWSDGSSSIRNKKNSNLFDEWFYWFQAILRTDEFPRESIQLGSESKKRMRKEKYCHMDLRQREAGASNQSCTHWIQFRMSNYLCVLSLVIINELLPELFNLLPFSASFLEKVLQLQQQYCSCSSGTFLNQFKISNYPCIPNLVTKYHQKL